MEDVQLRLLENLIGRSSGPMKLRLVIHLIVASVLAIRAGLKDAREGRPAFLWAAITNRAHRPSLLRQGSRDVGKVFVPAVVLGSIYQPDVQRGVYLLELLVAATVLSNRSLPYSRSCQSHRDGTVDQSWGVEAIVVDRRNHSRRTI